MRRFLQQPAGFTLVETLLAVSITLLVTVTAVGALLAGQRSSAKVAATEEQTQQLRLALRQISSDLNYARWDSGTPLSGTIFVGVYQPYTVLGTEDGGWPGDLDPSPPFWLSYTLTSDGSLIREVSDTSYGQYSRQILITGLAPDSSLTADGASQTIRVRLRKVLPGGKKIAEVASQFFLR